jgi:hypothetical protein
MTENNVSEKVLKVVLKDKGNPSVTFEGDYITKRELNLIMRSILSAHRQRIREYRKRTIIEEYNKQKEIEKCQTKMKTTVTSMK